MKQFIIISLLCFAVAGCGKGSAVTGKVSFEDGTPLTVGVVLFENPPRSFSGQIQSDGTYRLVGNTPKESVADGTYSVAVVKAIETAVDKDGKPTAVDVIDAKFGSLSTSALTCTVKGKTVYDITVSKSK